MVVFFFRTKRAFKKINYKILLLTSLFLTNSLPRHKGFCTLTELPTWVKPQPFWRQRQNSVSWLDFTLWDVFSKHTFQQYKMSWEPHANTTSTTRSQMFLHWHEQSWHLPSCGFVFSVYGYLDLNFGRKWYLYIYLHNIHITAGAIYIIPLINNNKIMFYLFSTLPLC